MKLIVDSYDNNDIAEYGFIKYTVEHTGGAYYIEKQHGNRVNIIVDQLGELYAQKICNELNLLADEINNQLLLNHEEEN